MHYRTIGKIIVIIAIVIGAITILQNSPIPTKTVPPDYGTYNRSSELLLEAVSMVSQADSLLSQAKIKDVSNLNSNDKTFIELELNRLENLLQDAKNELNLSKNLLENKSYYGASYNADTAINTAGIVTMEANWILEGRTQNNFTTSHGIETNVT